jgi:hypothetical protein
MAFKILVTDSLTDSMIEAGEKLTRFLDSVGFPVSASFWLYLPEVKVWRLTIASPLVSQYGPKEATRRYIEQSYLRLQTFLSSPRNTYAWYLGSTPLFRY